MIEGSLLCLTFILFIVLTNINFSSTQVVKKEKKDGDRLDMDLAPP